jgi:hypothetical protein
VFLEVILKLYDVCYFFLKNIFIAPWTCLHRSDLHILIMWPENIRRVNKICLHCGHFIHGYFLLNFVLYFSSSLQTVTINLPLYFYKSPAGPGVSDFLTNKAIGIIHRFSRLVTQLFHKWLIVHLNHKDTCILTLT